MAARRQRHSFSDERPDRLDHYILWGRGLVPRPGRGMKPRPYNTLADNLAALDAPSDPTEDELTRRASACRFLDLLRNPDGGLRERLSPPFPCRVSICAVPRIFTRFPKGFAHRRPHVRSSSCVHLD